MHSINVSSSEDEVEIVQDVLKTASNNDDSDDEIVFCGVVKATSNTFQDRSFLNKLGTDLIARNTGKNDKRLSDFTPSPQLTIRKISAAEIKEDLSDDDVEIISEEVFKRDCKKDKSDSNDTLKRLTNQRGLGIIIHDSTDSRNVTINIEDNDSSLQNKKVQLTFLGPRNERHEEDKTFNKKAYESSSLKDVRGNSAEKSRKKLRSSLSKNYSSDTSAPSPTDTKSTSVTNDLNSDNSRTAKSKHEKDSLRSKDTIQTEEPSFKVETSSNNKLIEIALSENNIPIERIPKVEVSETPEIYDDKYSLRSPETLHSTIKIEECTSLSVETPLGPLPITTSYVKRECTELIEPSESLTSDFHTSEPSTSEPSTSNQVPSFENDGRPGSSSPSIHENEAVNSPESYSEQGHKSVASNQDSGSTSSEEVDEATQSEVSNLFNKFLETCYLKDKSEQMKLAQDRLKKYFESAGSSVINDDVFRRKLQSSSNKLLETDTNPYQVMKKILDDLKAHPKGDPRIRKLEKALRKLNKKIQELEEAEVSSTDEEAENNYVLLDRYRSKAVQIYNKICELNNKPSDAERVYLRKVSFVGTLNLSEKNNQHDKILESIATQASHTLEKYYNKVRKFPDFQDVKKLVNKHCAEKKITKTEIIYLIAEQLFKGFGKELQNRRVYDDYTINFEYLPEGAEDPALTDPSLAEQLKKNDKLRKKESEVLQDFVNKQILLKEKGIEDVDDEDEKSKENKKDKSKKRSNDSEHSDREGKRHKGSSDEEDDILKSVGLKKSLVEKEPMPEGNSENEKADLQEESDNLL